MNLPTSLMSRKKWQPDSENHGHERASMFLLDKAHSGPFHSCGNLVGLFAINLVGPHNSSRKSHDPEESVPALKNLASSSTNPWRSDKIRFSFLQSYCLPHKPQTCVFDESVCYILNTICQWNTMAWPAFSGSRSLSAHVYSFL